MIERGDARRDAARGPGAARVAVARAGGAAAAGGGSRRLRRLRDVLPRGADGGVGDAVAGGGARAPGGGPDGLRLPRGGDAADGGGGAGVLRPEVARHRRGGLTARRARRR